MTPWLGPVWLALGVLAGATRPDARFADYQWDLGPRASWGMQGLAGRGRLAGGLRLWRMQTTQRIGVPGTSDPEVRATSLELVGQGRLFSAWGHQVIATTSTGWLHLGYAPDRVVIPGSGSGSDITVDFRPVDEWIGGAGIAVRRPLGLRWTAGLEVERRVFGMEAAHRAGSQIVVGREWFGDWSARLELAWVHRNG